MATNNFKPFATGTGANVTSQADWEALAALLTGFQSGKASSAQVNKALRQATFIAAALAQYTADKSGQNVLDDGDISGFVAKMHSAFGADFQPLDAMLTALASLNTVNLQFPVFNGPKKHNPRHGDKPVAGVAVKIHCGGYAKFAYSRAG
ncbi:hypothetical protein SAMN05192562_101272 [Kosakonia arachidis]|uniref:Phage tail fibre repeat-containing protein n=1 Tax=Kosakonia arachidis TaxID=551989 RepID=A0A1I6Y029_9ENTR|nr:hypothetical protein SAMN05192562_101272 [Kosakonia arachidis]